MVSFVDSKYTDPSQTNADGVDARNGLILSSAVILSVPDIISEVPVIVGGVVHDTLRDPVNPGYSLDTMQVIMNSDPNTKLPEVAMLILITGDGTVNKKYNFV